MKDDKSLYNVLFSAVIKVWQISKKESIMKKMCHVLFNFSAVIKGWQISVKESIMKKMCHALYNVLFSAVIKVWQISVKESTLYKTYYPFVWGFFDLWKLNSNSLWSGSSKRILVWGKLDSVKF